MTDAYIKFAFIALCFFVALVSYKFCHSKRDWACLSVAMGFTVVSDFFLVILQSYYIGVFTFCLVHIAYILRVSTDRGGFREFKIKKALLVFLAGLVFYFILFHFLLFMLPRLVIIAVIYAALFARNLVMHVKYYRRGGINSRIMLAGLILFALCDINVMLLNLPIILPELTGAPLPVGSPLFAVAATASVLIWVFYLPSQLLLSISAKRPVFRGV